MADEPLPLTIDSFDLAAAERLLCTEALRVARSIQIAASRIDKLDIPWTRSAGLVEP